MERTTVMLPEDLKTKAAKRAGNLGISLGQFIRQSLETALNSSKVQKLSEDPLFTDNTVFKGKAPRDLAKRHDKYIYEEVH